MINISKITYTYSKAVLPVLNDFSYCFESGEVAGISGRNGCGKTTLSKLMTGLLRPQSGSIQIDGADITNMNLFSIGQKIGYIWQNPARQLFCATCGEEIAFGLRNQGLAEAEIEEATMLWLDLFHLSELRESSPLHLSLGEKQRLALAAVLALGAPYLLLDEPTGGLDLRCRRELGLLLRNLAKVKNCGIIVISHEEDFLRRYCERKLVMN